MNRRWHPLSLAKLFVTALFVATGLAGSSSAQNVGALVFPGAEDIPLPHQKGHRFIHIPKPYVRLDAVGTIGSDYGSYDLSSVRTTLRLQTPVPLDHKSALLVTALFRYNGYEFQQPAQLFGPGSLSGDPVDPMMLATGRVIGFRALGKRWGIFAGAQVAFDWESGGDATDSVRGGGGVGLGWVWKERLAIAIGVGVKSRLDRSSVRVGPIGRIEWKINDDWKVETVGLGLAVRRRFGDTLALRLKGRVEGYTFLLKDRGGSFGAGFFKDRSYPILLELDWHPYKSLQVELQAGIDIKRRIKTEDQTGATVYEKTADSPAPLAGLRLKYIF
ncbi:DUF6268 family outer membrane beta-barrel protein [Myxococcota bacterium]|nr:DUF6268 family outer membrane beta-barrel protein [Myxococcota bacterium]